MNGRDSDPGPDATAAGRIGSPTDLATFEQLDMRVGVILDAKPFPDARKPSYRLRIDFGPRIGERRSSAQLVRSYPQPEALIGRQIVAVVNFPPRRIGPFSSEVLVLGALDPGKGVILLTPDDEVKPGARIA